MLNQRVPDGLFEAIEAHKKKSGEQATGKVTRVKTQKVVRRPVCFRLDSRHRLRQAIRRRWAKCSRSHCFGRTKRLSA